MKKFITISGLIATILSIIGMIFKIQHWMGATALLVFGFGFLILLFLPSFGYHLLYNFTDRKSKTAGVFGSVLFILIALGAIFKINHWPWAGIFLVLEFGFLVIFIFPVLMISKIKSSVNLKEKLLHSFWFISLAFVSLGYLFKINHWSFASMLLIIGALFISLGYLPLAVKLYNNEENRKKLYNRFVIITGVLVFTLMVANSVSVSILNSFVNIDNSIKDSEKSPAGKLKLEYAFIKQLRGGEEGSSKNSDYAKVEKVKELSNDLYNHIEKLKIHLIRSVSGQFDNVPDDSIKLRDIDSKDNYDGPTRIMIGNPENINKSAWSANELKNKIIIYKEDLLSMFDEQTKKEMIKTMGLNTDGAYSLIEERIVDWENENFYHQPLAAILTLLSKIELDIKTNELATVEYLHRLLLLEQQQN